MLKIEVAYGNAKQQSLLSLDVEEGQTLQEILQKNFSQFDFQNKAIGVWGRVVNADYKLKENDRIEIYQPLMIDPKEERRKRGMTTSKVKPNKRKNIRNYKALLAAGLISE